MTDLIPNTHVKLEADDGTGTWPHQLTKVGNINVVRGDAEPGVITAEVADASFDPVTSTALRTNKPVRLRVANGVGGWTTVASGKVDEPSTDYDPRPGAKTPVKVKFNAIDNVRALQGIPEARGVGTMAQLKRLLNGTGISFKINGSTSPDAAAPTVVATNPNASLWDQILITRDSLLGYAWVDKDNVLNAYDQASMPGTSVATLGPSVYTDIDLDFAVEQIINTVTVNWRRYDIGTEDSADVPYGPYVDGSSVTSWGNRTAEFTIQGATEVEADIIAFADEVLARNADAEVRPKSMIIPIQTVADLAYVRNIDINSRVTVVYPDGVTSKVMRVSGINHAIQARIDDYRRMTWFLTLEFALPNGVSMPSRTPDTGNNVVPDNVVTEDQLDVVENDLQDQVDELLDELNDQAGFIANKNTVYRQTAKPTGGVYRAGDLWFDTDDGNRIYIYVAGGTNDFVDSKTSYLATPNGKLLVTPLGLYCYDASNVLKFFLDAGTGSITMAGPIVTGGAVDGATVTGGTLQSTNLTNRGIKINSTFLIAYDGSGNPTLAINASTGAITMKGELTSGSTITGALFRTNTTGQRIQVRGDLSSGIIDFYSGLASESPGKLDPAANSGRPNVILQPSSTPTNSHVPFLGLTSGTSSGAVGDSATLLTGMKIDIGNRLSPSSTLIRLLAVDCEVSDDLTVGATMRALDVARLGSDTVTTVPNVQMNASGFIKKTTHVNSSRRYKRPARDGLAEIETAELDVEAILKLRPVAYRLKPDAFPGLSEKDAERVQYGFIAEEADDLGLKFWVERNEAGEIDVYDYTKHTVALQAVARQQAEKLRAQDVRIDTLEGQVKGLLELLNAEGSASDG